MAETASVDPSLLRARALIACFERETLRHDPLRQARGAFYTPIPLARAMARMALGHASTSAPPTIVDPAAGGGRLLLEYLDVMACQHASRSNDVNTHHAQRVARRRAHLPGVVGLDVDPDAVALLRDVLACACDIAVSALPQHCVGQADGVLDPWPVDTCDVVVANPPFGSVNQLGRSHPWAVAVAKRFGQVWQDKVDRSIFFMARALEHASRGVFLMPSSVLAAAKAQRWRAHMRQRRLRFLDLGDAQPFGDAAVTVCLLSFRDQTPPLTFEGWRCLAPATVDDVEEIVSSFAAGQRCVSSSPVVTSTQAPESATARWYVVSAARRARWSRMDHAAVCLGDRYLVGKGMETGCNRAFELATARSERVSLSMDRPWLRARLRSGAIGRWHASPSTSLIYTPGVVSFDALPHALKMHLERWREVLEKRAAFRRGDCEWWRFAWPLHAASYDQWRVVTPYRSKEHRFAVVAPSGGVGLTDTSVVFVDAEDHAWALAGLMMSAPMHDRFAGLTKHTGQAMREFFENQLREVPLPACWDSPWRIDFSALARAVAADEVPPSALDQAVARAFEL